MFGWLKFQLLQGFSKWLAPRSIWRWWFYDGYTQFQTHIHVICPLNYHEISPSPKKISLFSLRKSALEKHVETVVWTVISHGFQWFPLEFLINSRGKNCEKVAMLGANLPAPRRSRPVKTENLRKIVEDLKMVGKIWQIWDFWGSFCKILKIDRKYRWKVRSWSGLNMNPKPPSTQNGHVIWFRQRIVVHQYET